MFVLCVVLVGLTVLSSSVGGPSWTSTASAPRLPLAVPQEPQGRASGSSPSPYPYSVASVGPPGHPELAPVVVRAVAPSPTPAAPVVSAVLPGPTQDTHGVTAHGTNPVARPSPASAKGVEGQPGLTASPGLKGSPEYASKDIQGPSPVSIPTSAGLATSSGSGSEAQLGAGPAPAATASVSCTTSGSTLTVTISNGGSTDSLVVTTGSSAWAISFDGGAVCPGYSSTTYPTVVVTETPTNSVPTTFQPGTSTGLTLEGGAPGITTLSLATETSAFTVAMNADSVTTPGTVTGAGVSDMFTGISSVTGSPGGTTFQPGSATGVSLEGTGSGNTLDLSGEPSGLTVGVRGDTSANPGILTGTALSDTFSGITSFLGSSAGSTTFQPGSATGVSFEGAGSGNTLDLSGEPSGLSVAANGDSTASPGTVTGAGVSDSFSGLGTVDGPSAGGTTFLTGSQGGLNFIGQGSSNTLNFGAAPSGATVTLSGTPTAYSGMVNGLLPGFLSSTTDDFAGIQFFVPAFSTSTSATSSLDPSTFGQAVAVTATVSPTDGGGTVTFYDGTSAICSGVTLTSTTSGYQATCSTSSLGTGTHSITAQYSGDTNYAGSPSSALTQTVDPASTAVATTVYDATTGTPWSSTEVTGAQSYDTASVSGEQLGTAPTGTLTYQLYPDGTCSGTPLASTTGALSGGVVSPSSTSPALGAGSYSDQGTYSGDSNYLASISACEVFSVGRDATATLLVVAPTVVDLGESAKLTATVAPSASGGFPVTGVVTFSVAGSSLGTCSLTSVSGGVCSLTTTSFPLGTDSLTASYSGDANFLASTITSSLTVNSALTAPGIPDLTASRLDAGQASSLRVNDTIPASGTAGYSWTWLVSLNNGAYASSIGICATPSGSGASAGTPVSCQFAGSYAPQLGVPYRFELNVVDSASPAETTYSSPSPAVSLEADLVGGGPSPIQPTIDAGQTVLLVANPLHGWTPYGYQWYAGSSSNCGADSTVNGAVTSTFSVSPTTTTYYCYQVNDSANVSEHAFSSADLVVVDPALGVASLTASRTALDVGQSVLLSATVSGGSGSYSFVWGKWSPLPNGCATSNTASLTCMPTSVGAGSFAIAVTVTDSNGVNLTSASVTLTVSPDPALTAPSATPAALDAGQSTSISVGSSVGSGTPTYTWVGLPVGCLSSNAATLTCAPTAAGSYIVAASLQDSNGFNVTSSWLTLTVSSALSSPSLVASRTSLDAGQTTTLTAGFSGGAGTITYSWAGLPAGCAAAPAAVLTCTPSGAGTFLAHLWVNDSNRASVTASQTLTVSSALSLAGFSASASAADAGQWLNYSVAVQGGAGGWAYAWSDLPAGCSGSGTKADCASTGAGFGEVSVTVTDANGASVGSPSLPYTVFSDPTLSTLTLSRAALDAGQLTTLSVSTVGGAGGFTYAWSGLPPGCGGTDLSAVTCAPTAAGTFAVSVAVTDANGWHLTSAPATLTVSPSLFGASLSLNRGSLDLGQSTQLTASVRGGAGGMTYTWTNLPSGCSSLSQATLTCQPSTSGVAWLSVTANDSNGATVVAGPVELTVVPALGTPTATSSASSLDTGSLVIFTAAVTGGAGPFTYAWTGLPSGCVGTTTVTVSCTPEAAGALTVSVTVTDANGAVSTASNVVSVVVSTSAKSATSSALASTNGMVDTVLGLAVAALVVGLLALLLSLRSPTRGAAKAGQREVKTADPRERKNGTEHTPEPTSSSMPSAGSGAEAPDYSEE